jgi:cold-inducible RNA-binding protein
MDKKLYVGNLPHSVTDHDLQNLFESYGIIQSAHVIVDRDTGLSKRFGIVEMDNADEAQAAIASLNGQGIDGRALIVCGTRPGDERFWRSGLEFASDYFG